MIDFITISGLLIILALTVALVPLCPCSVICPPFCACTIPMLLMLMSTTGGLFAYWMAGGPSTLSGINMGSLTGGYTR